MPVAAVDVIYLPVRDLELWLAFYRELVGIPMEIGEYDSGWAEVRFDGVRLAVHLGHRGAEPRAPSSVRLSLCVDDAVAAAERLRAAGATVSDVQHEPWGAVCEATDPSGYGIGLFSPAGEELQHHESEAT